MRAAPDREVHLTPHDWLVLSGEPVADMNMGLVAGGPQPVERLRVFGQLLHQRRLPGLIFFTEAVANPLAPTAVSLGLQPAGPLPLMVRDTATVTTAASPYDVRRVTDEKELAIANQLVADAFSFPLATVNRVSGPGALESPGVSLFVAWDGEQPRSTVATVQVGPHVSVWSMATPPAHQRKGAGRAILDHVFVYHAQRGATVFYLLASAAGKPLYDRAGFRTVAELAVWCLGHSTQVVAH
jgi:hypothetical protein